MFHVERHGRELERCSTWNIARTRTKIRIPALANSRLERGTLECPAGDMVFHVEQDKSKNKINYPTLTA
jgi:hypothetical protein